MGAISNKKEPQRLSTQKNLRLWLAASLLNMSNSIHSGNYYYIERYKIVKSGYPHRH